MEMTRDWLSAILLGLFNICNGLHNIRIAHVSRGIVVLIYGEDSTIMMAFIVQCEKVRRVLCDDVQIKGVGTVEMNHVILAIRVYVAGPNHVMTSLPEKVSQQIGIRAIIKIQFQGH